jgi:pilus assembly protein CpaB
MSVRNILLVVAALLITLGTGLLARSWLNSQRVETAAAPMAEAVPASTYVLVANEDLPSGMLLKKEHVRWQAWPDESLPEIYIVRLNSTPEETATQEAAADEEILGAVVRRGISAGEPIARGRIIKAGERGFLAAVLRPGFRAMSVRVDATTGIAGFVQPGDRVDVILTHQIPRGDTIRRASETILGNVRVLAIDQTTNDETGEAKVGKNATFELTAKQTELLTVANDIGSLSLALRSLAIDDEEMDRLVNSGDPLAEAEPERGQTYTWDSEVSRLIWRPSGANQDIVQVNRGKESQEQRFDKRQ